MPLYEYQCLNCEKVHEVMQKFSDAPLQECPECKGPVSKLMSLSSFALKGSGWYTTDYKRSQASPAKAETEAKPAASPAVSPAPSESSSAPSAPASEKSS
jgi:putative FmdB family regulatory protein